MKKVLLQLLTGSLCLGGLHSQSIWLERSETVQLRLEYLRPSLKYTFPGLEVSTNLFSFNSRIPIAKGISVLFELPYSLETTSSGSSSLSRSGFGNPYVGFEIGVGTFPLYGEIGVRPISPKEFYAIGAYYGDFDRVEAYIADMTSFHFALNFASAERKGFVYHARVGPTIWNPKTGNKTTTILDYGIKLGYDNGQISGFAGLTGRWNTEVSSRKSSYHHLGFDLGYHIDRFRPGLFVRLPLDKEFSDYFSQTFGGSITVEI